MIDGLGSGTSLRLNRYLKAATTNVARSLERLSSGRRLIPGVDSGSELAREQDLQSQIRGVNQAMKNVSDAQGLTRQAQSALDQMLNISYRLRELAQEAANSGLTDAERDNLSAQAQDLVEDLSRLATSTNYNNTNLLDGTFGTKSLQVGAGSGDQISFSMGDARSSILGRLAITSGTQGNITTALLGATINGVTVSPSVSDGVSSSNATYSAMAIARAVNDVSNETGVYAETVGTVRSFTLDGVGTFTGTLAVGDLQINGVDIEGTGISSASTLVSAINTYSSTTGVVASIATSGAVTLTASDGRNIQLIVSNASSNNFFDFLDLSSNSTVFSAYATLSAGQNHTHTGAIRLWSSEAIVIAGTNASASLGVSSGTLNYTSGTAVNFVSLNSTDDAEEAIKVLDATIAQISTLRSNVDAVHSRLDLTASGLLEDLNAKESARSAIGDTDYARETANLVLAQLLQNASLSALTQANVSQSVALKLLQGLE